jgi:outer membrane protein assembly factor BamB
MNPRRIIRMLVGSTLALTLAHSLAQDWPQWRGPNRDGRSAGFTAPATWPKELTPKWKVTVGEGVATPALAGDRLYVFSRQDGAEVTRCLEAASGKELWSDKYDSLGAEGPSSGFSGPRSSPTVADGKVVTLGIRGVLSCFDAASGKLLWRKEDFKGAWPRFFASSSPLATGGLCVAQLGGPNNGGVVAYDLATGGEKWRWTGDAPAYASPVLLTLDGATYVVAETDTKIVALGLADGKLAWETPFAVQGRGYNAATPIVNGQTLIYAGSGRGVTAVKIEKQGGALAAKELWKNPDSSVQFDTPVLKDGFVYGLSAGNDLFCLNARDGKTAWTAPLAPPAAGGGEAPAPPAGPGGARGGRGGGMRGGSGGFGSIADAGTVLMALTPSSELVVFKPDPTAYAEVARIKVAGTPTHAYPVVSGKRIFVKDQDSVALLAVP